MYHDFLATIQLNHNALFFIIMIYKNNFQKNILVLILLIVKIKRLD